MNRAFGTDFIILNDVIQPLDTKVFQGGPWEHLATVGRGLRQYMAFRRSNHNPNHARGLDGYEVWIEIIDPHELALTQIEDDTEWLDVANFLKHAKLLEIGVNTEFRIAKPRV
tara:strand:- start:406 stop:744 length:339 start_codon:yes stop_codon:yes gene_type:complete